MQLRPNARLVTAIVTVLLATPLWATNGYFTHGIGTKNKGMAGAGLALPEEPISIANNPASALHNAGKYTVGLAVFSPLRHYETSESMYNGQGGTFTIGPNSIDSDNNYFWSFYHICYSSQVQKLVPLVFDLFPHKVKTPYG